tara:strand:- start:2497 stop:3933 length:1437 start_codon:yes stop_codon:yes gene_type:complete
MKVIEVSIPSFPKSLDPREVWNYFHFMLVQNVHSTLVRIDENGRLQSYIASKWSIENEGKKFIFTIEPNAMFHDSSSVTATDVAWSLSRHLWPSSPSVTKGYLMDVLKGASDIKEGQILPSIKVLSDKSFELNLARPYLPLLQILSIPSLSIVKKDRPDVGAGPMILEKMGDVWSFTRFDRFFKANLNTRSLKVRALKDTNAIEKYLDSHKVDIILGVPIGDIATLKLPSDYGSKRTHSLSYHHLFFNMKNESFSDLKFRRDLSHLVQNLASQSNYDSLYQKAATGLLPLGIMPRSYYDRSVPKISKESFLKKWAKNTKEKSLKLVIADKFLLPTFTTDLEKLLKNLGYNLTVIKADGATLVKHLKNEDYDLISGPYVGNFQDPDGFLEPLNDKSGIRFGNFPAKALNEKIEKARFINDAQERLKKYEKALIDFENEFYFIPLYSLDFAIIHNKSLRVPDSSYRYEAELWHIFWQVEK